MTIESFLLRGQVQPTLAMQVQRPSSASRGDVLYAHGSTFGASLSIFFALDGRSWADALNDEGFTAWGVDFAGYGHSDRYFDDCGRAAGRLEEVVPQLRRGEWDTVCDANDARSLLDALGASVRDSAVIERATHLMHLEAQRAQLYNVVNTFLDRSMQ